MLGISLQYTWVNRKKIIAAIVHFFTWYQGLPEFFLATMSNTKKIESPSPYQLSSSDNSGVPLVMCLLTGNNYSTWARSMKKPLNAKNNLRFVDRTLTKPDVGDPEFQLWTICNSVIIVCITNSLDKSLQRSVAYAVDAKALWDDLRERFSQGNAPWIFQLRAKISRLCQEGMSVASYCTKLKVLWNEINDYSQKSVCTCRAAKDAS